MIRSPAETCSRTSENFDFTSPTCIVFMGIC
jgi:hypothetical protein